MIENPWALVPKDILFLNGSLQFISSILLMAVGLSFLRRFMIKKTKSLKWLAFCYILMGFGIMCGSLSMVISWLEYDNVSPSTLVLGIPLPYLTNVYWPLFNMAYQFGPASHIFMMLFIHDVFQKPNKKILNIYNSLIIMFIIFSFWHGVFIYGVQWGYPNNASSIGAYGVVIFLILGIIPYFFLLKYSRNLVRSQTDQLIAHGMRLIERSAIATLLANLLFCLDNLLSLNSGYIGWLVSFIGAFIIYLGFTMPQWYTNWYKRHFMPQ